MSGTCAARSAEAPQCTPTALPRDLPQPILEDIAERVFDVADGSMAARAQLSLVCKCGARNICSCSTHVSGHMVPTGAYDLLCLTKQQGWASSQRSC